MGDDLKDEEIYEMIREATGDEKKKSINYEQFVKMMMKN